MMGKCEILVILLSDKFDAFYHTYNCLDDGSLIEFFRNLDLWDFQSLIESAEKYGIDFFYVKYKDVFLETIKAAILAYMEDVDVDYYFWEDDIYDYLETYLRNDGYHMDFDRELINIICEQIKRMVEQEVSEIIEEFPQDILKKIIISRSDVNIEKSDIKRLIEEYIERYVELFVLEYDHHERDYDYGIVSEMDVLDCIFR